MWLYIDDPDAPTPFEGDRFLIGSSPGSDVVLDDPRVSPEHAWIEANDGRATIKDLGSLQGTWVNGERVTTRDLFGGERIEVGNTVLRVSTGKPAKGGRVFGRWRIAAAAGGATALGVLLALLLLPGGGGDRSRIPIPTDLGPQAPPTEQGVGARRRIQPALGVNAQFLFALPAAQVNTQLDAMARAGVRLVRMDADWQLIEPGPPTADGSHRWRWARYDPFMEAFARRGIEWLPVLAYSTTWSTSRPDAPVPTHAPPKDLALYAAFASAFAQRYGERGSFWREHPELPPRPVKRYEIWNEPNLAKVFWWPKPDPRAFAVMYLQARTAIKAVDPAALVISGGLAGRDDAPSFAKRMFRAVPQLRGRVDGFGFHPYGRTAQESYIRTKLVRRALASAGQAGLPIEITEVGWSTPPGASASKGRVVSEKQRARFLSEVTRVYPRSDCGVRVFAPHTWVSFERDAANPEDWFGIWNLDGSSKPSGRAFVTQLRKAQAASSKPKYRICG